MNVFHLVPVVNISFSSREKMFEKDANEIYLWVGRRINRLVGCCWWWHRMDSTLFSSLATLITKNNNKAKVLQWKKKIRKILSQRIYVWSNFPLGIFKIFLLNGNIIIVISIVIRWMLSTYFSFNSEPRDAFLQMQTLNVHPHSLIKWEWASLEHE